MDEEPADALALLAGILSRMQDVVGEGASYAMLHYGAVEEGKRLGARIGGDLPRLLGAIDALLGQRTEVARDAGDEVTLVVRGGRLLRGDRATRGLVLGLLEGALGGARGARYSGTASSAGGAVVLELRRAAPG